MVAESLQANRAFNLFHKIEDADLKRLAKAFGSDWTDGMAAEVVGAYGTRVNESGEEIELESLCRWIRLHPNDPQAVRDCLHLLPPEDVQIIRRLPKKGSQKLVFFASWKLTRREIVLKWITGTPEHRQTVLGRESLTHPFSMGHPNIIETHFLVNRKQELFLAEDKMPVVLDDDWQSGGLQEAANLLYDLARALHFVHVELLRAHGDIKPDNIGCWDGSYILLDFGICRPIKQFQADTTATGSMRTRAPELFETNRYADDPTKADVWSLGATVLKGVIGRFPFVDPGEEVPKVENPRRRAAFEAIIRDRVRIEWERRTNLAGVPEDLAKVLGRVLVRDPKDRASAADVIRLCEQNLGGFLRGHAANGQLTAMDELDQLVRHLPKNEALMRMPRATRQNLRARLEVFVQAGGLDHDRRQGLEDLLARL